MTTGWFADLSDRRFVLVRGPDAIPWLNDLLTAEMTGMAAGQGRRTLLLTPTGRIRADLWATPLEDGVLLVQDPAQPDPIDRLLDRYVLSSEVTLDDRSGSLLLAAFPDGTAPAVPGVAEVRPSSLGPGVDVLGPTARAEELTSAAEGMGLRAAHAEELEAWRIRRGIPRFPVDLTTDSLPHEVPLDEAIAFDKGCYLGQEAVAKVRNLGHPPYVLRAVRIEGPATAGDEVHAEGERAGTVTSAVSADGATEAIIRIRWASRDRPLATASGAIVTPSAAS